MKHRSPNTYRGRPSGAMPFGVGENPRLALASATDAVSIPTITEILNNDTVVQRRGAHRPCASITGYAQHAAVGRWLRRCSHLRSS
jgi:hypothetical protein